MNNSYLIMKGEVIVKKVSYRNNLIEELQHLTNSNLNNAGFKDIVRAAEEQGYQIYQLTQL